MKFVQHCSKNKEMKKMLQLQKDLGATKKDNDNIIHHRVIFIITESDCTPMLVKSIAADVRVGTVGVDIAIAPEAGFAIIIVPLFGLKVICGKAIVLVLVALAGAGADPMVAIICGNI
mmetsp:Transcript_11031/g.15467  ORF Transcript_11031/g.15467 Transcript_11031/m.15467 type:complete len:118 (-) Transcript_11031:351-704(-)